MSFFRRIFGRGGSVGGERTTTEPALSANEVRIIGTEEDLMRDYDAQAERNFQAMEAEQSGDSRTAIALYEQSVSEEFVGAHPYERLGAIYARTGRPDDALRVTESFIRLAGSGRLPKGSQRSADMRLPEFKERAARLRGQSR